MEENSFVQAGRIADDTPKPLTAKEKFNVNWFLRFIFNRKNQLSIFAWVFALSVPVLMYYFLVHTRIVEDSDSRTCSISEAFRVPCGKENITVSECKAIACCFDDTAGECFHYLPSTYGYQKYNDGFRPTRFNSPLRTLSVPNMRMDVQELNVDMFRVTLYNSSSGDSGYNHQRIDDATYNITLLDQYMEIDVVKNNHLILTTSLGPLIASRKYLEWTFYMGDNLFGFDRLHFTGNETVRNIFYFNSNNHTTLPIFMAYKDGSFHSLRFEYDGPVEFIVLPSRLIIVRAIAAQRISFTVNIGSSPRHITQQMYNFKLPPKWVLEPHICRNGNINLTVAIADYLSFNENNTDLVKYASDCFHENLYFMLFTADTAARELLHETLDVLKENSRFLLSISPHVPVNNNSELYNTALEQRLLYLKSNSTEVQNGTFTDLEVAYPDYSAADIEIWLTELFKMFPTGVDGYVFNNNWASDDPNPIDLLENFPYFDERFSNALSHTLLWNATINGEEHINRHNSYGRNQLTSYMNQLGNQGDDPLILSSIFSHDIDAIAQIQNVNGTWANLKGTLQKALLHSIFVHPLISVPICGSTSFFNLTAQADLCSRWYIMGATMPMFRISSESPMRDPSNLPTGQARDIALTSIERRMMFSSYYYTLLTLNEPIIRPMFYDFYKDASTFDLDEQYMVGDALLVAQPFLVGLSLLRLYLPPEGVTFYEFFGGMRYEDNLGWISLTAVPSDWFIFIRGGYIVPLFQESYYSLAIALGGNFTASTGSLYLEDDVYLHLKADENQVTISNILEAKSALGCGTDNNSISSFGYFYVYGLENDRVRTINSSFDLCDMSLDEKHVCYDDQCRENINK